MAKRQRSGGLSITITGDKQAEMALQAVRYKYPRAYARALYERAVYIFNESQMLVPVKTGRLRSSGTVFPPTNIRRPIAKITYGTNYAYWVHERTELRHPVGQAKYLSTPFFRQLPGMVPWLARRTMQLVEMGDVSLPSMPTRGQETPAAARKPQARDERGRYVKGRRRK